MLRYDPFVCLDVRPDSCVNFLFCSHHEVQNSFVGVPFVFIGVIDLDLQGQIELQSKNSPHFARIHAVTHHQLKLEPPNLDPIVFRVA